MQKIYEDISAEAYRLSDWFAMSAAALNGHLDMETTLEFFPRLKNEYVKDAPPKDVQTLHDTLFEECKKMKHFKVLLKAAMDMTDDGFYTSFDQMEYFLPKLQTYLEKEKNCFQYTN